MSFCSYAWFSFFCTITLIFPDSQINTLKGNGADLSTVNSDNRTALHIACCEGNEKVVKYLLLNGANVHIRDRHDRTPLMEAISRDHHAIIKLLIKCGAHITGSNRAVGEHLCGAASRGRLQRLESYCLAGADLSLPDPTGTYVIFSLFCDRVILWLFF